MWIFEAHNLCDYECILQGQTMISLVDCTFEQTFSYDRLVFLVDCTKLVSEYVRMPFLGIRSYFAAVLRQYLSIPFLSWIMAR